MTAPRAPSRRARIAGRVLSALAILFLALDGVMKLALPAPVVESFVRMGIPVDLATTLGLLELCCTVIYAIPRTAPFGALLLTAYLGGAVCSHLRLHDPLWSHTMFPVYLGVIAWAGLWLRGRALPQSAVRQPATAHPT